MSQELLSTPLASPSLRGDPARLWESLGSMGGEPTAAWDLDLRAAQVADAPGLRRFLEAYRDQVVFPVELAVIQSAHHHTCHHQPRELIALDRQLSADPRLARFAAASQAVGRTQLRRLLPLRDVRLLQRYWAALERGEARGWHPVVYGIALGLFCIPLRPGLGGYAHQTLTGFLAAGARALRLPEPTRDALHHDLVLPIPAAIEASLQLPPGLHVVA